MTAKGKITAANVQTGDRIIVKHYSSENEADRATLEWLGKDSALGISTTKTGEGVTVARVLSVEAYMVQGRRAQRRYTIYTTEGVLENNAPAQTMMLAPEDAAGIKRAHAEALELDKVYEAYPLADDEAAAEAAEADYQNADMTEVEAHKAAVVAEVAATLAPAADPLAFVSLPVRPEGRSLVRPADLRELLPASLLTLNSHAGKVDSMNNDANNATQTASRERTGSAVVRLLERVQERIRQNHPEVPEVVIVTGAGIGPMGGKWGHFRPQGWTAKDEADRAEHIHEMFMAGETLAKGARQVLQTMLHENGHGLAQVRGIQDTSRQNRWHNKEFLKIARELGLDYRKPKANPTIGYSEVVLTEETIEEYRDLLDLLDAEIHLMVRLPGWLGGTTSGEDDEEGDGGENMPKAPKPPAAPNTNNIKAVCRCDEPNIIRLSRKVLDKGLVRCDECDSLFSAA